MNRFFIVFCLLYLISATAFPQDRRFVPASDKNFRYVGRCDFSNPDEIKFDWSGVYIQFRFTGSYLSLKMDDTKHNYYNVFLDDEPVRVIDVKSDTLIVIAEGLQKKEHWLQLYKRTEGEQGTGTFKGIDIDNKGELFFWDDVPSRKIEFIGNSITCGYGTEGKNAAEHFKPETENNYHSYAPVIARAFHADYHIAAHSGQGAVRNYGDKNKVSSYNMPVRYLQLFDQQKEPLWNFSEWIPDAVVINLGTNDFSTRPFPDKVIFQKGYENLILKVREFYGDIPVFCVVGPMIDEPCYSYVKEMVDNFRKVYRTGHVYFIGIPQELMVKDKDLGSDSHPNYKGQRKMAAHVTPVISSVMGWNYDGQEIRK